MKDYLFADTVTRTITGGNDLKAVKVGTPEEIGKYDRVAAIVLMEVTGRTPYLLSERLRIRDRLKEANPSCKVVLVVDENSEAEIAEKIKRAKIDGLIDLFIYGSISASYLKALLETL